MGIKEEWVQGVWVLVPVGVWIYDNGGVLGVG